MIRVLIADDQALIRAGFRLILETQSDLDVVGEAVNGKQAVGAARELTPDVILMDIRMPDMDGIEATRRIVTSTAAPRVLILTTFDLDEYVHRAMSAGASGFLLKDAPPDELATAIRVVHRGEALLAPAITQRLIEGFTRRPEPGSVSTRLSDLTPRETEVLTLIARGQTNREIGAALYLTDATVKTHITRIFAKLGLRDRVQAVITGYEEGLVAIGESPRPAPVE